MSQVIRFAEQCAHNALVEGKNVEEIIEEALENRSLEMLFIAEAQAMDLRLPADWGMPELKGASYDEIRRAFLRELLLATARNCLKLVR